MKTPIYVILFLLITLDFLVRAIYHFWIIALEGGIILKESNLIIVIFECSLALASFIILGIFAVQSILERAHEKVS